MILIIDNYDSFTYNLYQYAGEIEPDIIVRRNDEISISDIESMNPDHIIISPGPGYPADAGICEDVIRSFAGKVPILGVCLGHQAMGEVFGGKVVHAKEMVHGKTSEILHDGKGLFEGVDSPDVVMRYHSLVVEQGSMDECIDVCAMDEYGQIMALRHREFEIHGVQFHPESIGTDSGKRMIENFLKIKRA